MPAVADVLRRHGGEYLQRFDETMPAEHKKVLRAIVACRTGQLGTVVYTCSQCGRTHAMGRSCGNRHCPTCQQDRQQVHNRRLPGARPANLHLGGAGCFLGHSVAVAVISL